MEFKANWMIGNNTKSLSISYRNATIVNDNYVIKLYILTKQINQKTATISLIEKSLINRTIFSKKVELLYENNDYNLSVPLTNINNLAEIGDYEFVVNIQCDGLESETKKFVFKKIIKQTNKDEVDKNNKDVGIRIRFVKKAISGRISITDFITLIEKEENKFPENERVNTKLMITRLRKIFYNTPGWDNYLIKKTKDIKSPYKDYIWRDRPNTNRQIDPKGLLNSFNVVDKEYYPYDKEVKRMPDIYLNQEVYLEKGSHNGIYIDMGHVLCGMDAYNNFDNVTYKIQDAQSAIQIVSNIDAVTWVGDLGSVLAEAKLLEIIKDDNKGLTDAEIQSVIDEFAPAQDMLGNIDAYVIAKSYDISTVKGKKVSEIFKDYYLGSGVDKFQKKRYSTFFNEIYINRTKNKKFTSDDDFINYYMDEVNDSASLYILINSLSSNETLYKKVIAFLSTGQFALGVALMQNTLFIKLFLRDIKKAIETEKYG